jgi:hypothetical protein
MIAAGEFVLTEVQIVVETLIAADLSGTPWELGREDAHKDDW